MKQMILLAAMVLVALSGCARIVDSRVNPMNWFDRAAPTADAPVEIEPLVPQQKVVTILDERALAQQITRLEVVPTSGGVLVQAEGVAATSGTFSVQLVEASRVGGTLRFELRHFSGTGTGGRSLSAAEFVSNVDLGGITRIEVSGATNTLARSAG